MNEFDLELLTGISDEIKNLITENPAYSNSRR